MPGHFMRFFFGIAVGAVVGRIENLCFGTADTPPSVNKIDWKMKKAAKQTYSQYGIRALPNVVMY